MILGPPPALANVRFCSGGRAIAHPADHNFARCLDAEKRCAIPIVALQVLGPVQDAMSISIPHRLYAFPLLKPMSK